MLLVHLRLVESGYGSLSEVKEMNSREVIQALHFKKFLADYESAFIEMHKK